MSSIATNPSAALTCSPSRTSLQKRQSGCDANDALLRDVVRAGPDELALRRVEEPGGVVVAVSTPWAVDEHRLLPAHLPWPTPPAGIRRRRSQACAPLLLHGRGDAVFVRGQRARPGRVGED